MELGNESSDYNSQIQTDGGTLDGMKDLLHNALMSKCREMKVKSIQDAELFKMCICNYYLSLLFELIN